MTGPRSRYIEEVSPYSGIYWKGNQGHRYPSGTTTPIGHAGVLAKNELLVSQGNPFHKLGKSRRAIGGKFFVIKRERTGKVIPPRPYSSSTDPHSIGFHYDGPVMGSLGFPSPFFSSSAELEALGTNAIANVLPTNPVSGLFVALGELKRDGIPSLLGVQSWRNRTQAARAAGSEYLNHQFGWVPLVNDLKKFSYSVSHSDELIAQYERNSGKRIKRQVDLPSVKETTVYSGAARTTSERPWPNLSGMYRDNSWVQVHLTTTKSKRRWFEGCFSYYLPPFNPNGDNVKRNEQLANYLYGTRVTPEGIWDLTPWSWAADWVGNFGNVLHNVSAFQQDGLVMPYAYVMEEGIHEVTAVWPRLNFHTYGLDSLSVTMRTTVKQRIPATPYGFGLNTGSFSTRQWSILAALGLARSDGSLFK